MKKKYYAIVLLVLALQSCKVYKQDIMFQLDDDFSSEDLSHAIDIAHHNYKIQPGDLLSLQVFTNKGERIIDPNFELMKQIGGANIQNQQINPRYLVQENGLIKFPLLDTVNITGLTLIEAEAKLNSLYNSYYKDSYTILEYLNKRVVVLGAGGGIAIPIENQNTTLLEVLALYGGVSFGAKAHNIKVIRGDLQNPKVYMVDLSTIAKMTQSITDIQPGDVIYIEPWRRPIREVISDTSPVLSLVSSILALTLVIQNASR